MAKDVFRIITIDANAGFGIDSNSFKNPENLFRNENGHIVYYLV